MVVNACNPAVKARGVVLLKAALPARPSSKLGSAVQSRAGSVTAGRDPSTTTLVVGHHKHHACSQTGGLAAVNGVPETTETTGNHMKPYETI